MVRGKRVLAARSNRKTAVWNRDHERPPATTGPGWSEDARLDSLVALNLRRIAFRVFDSAVVMDNGPTARPRLDWSSQSDHPIEGRLAAAGIDQQE
jgi:hypothetical protein